MRRRTTLCGGAAALRLGGAAALGLGGTAALGLGGAAALCSAAPTSPPEVTLFEFGTTRSARCRWLMLELGMPFTAVATRPHAADVLKLNPRGKLPIAVIDGHTVTESAAICSYLADLAAEHGGPRLIPPAGTLERAQHDQWVSFTLTELDSWRWHSFIAERALPEAERSASVAAMNDRMWSRSIKQVLEPHLASGRHFLVGDTFSCADIILGWSLNWGRRSGLLGEDTPATNAYLDRLLARPLCALAKD